MRFVVDDEVDEVSYVTPQHTFLFAHSTFTLGRNAYSAFSEAQSTAESQHAPRDHKEICRMLV